MCGCNKNRARAGDATPSTTTTVTNFEVVDSNGNVTLTFTNPVSARAEARRIGGTVRPQSSATEAEITTPPVTEG